MLKGFIFNSLISESEVGFFLVHFICRMPFSLILIQKVYVLQKLPFWQDFIVFNFGLLKLSYMILNPIHKLAIVLHES